MAEADRIRALILDHERDIKWIDDEIDARRRDIDKLTDTIQRVTQDRKVHTDKIARLTQEMRDAEASERGSSNSRQ